MDFMIQRQEEFASQMAQQQAAMTQQQAAMAQQQTAMAQQQAMIEHINKAIAAMIETQERTSADVANLTAFTKRLADFVTSSNNGKS